MRGSTVIKYAKQNTNLMVGIGLGAVLGVASITAWVDAAVPDTDGKIYACYTAQRVRIIDRVTTNCSNNETAISWHHGGPGNFKEDLTNVDFSGAHLQARNFTGINLSNSDFRSARLNSSNLQGANLSGIQLASTNLNKVNAAGANFSGAIMSQGNEAVGANFQGADFSNAQLASFHGGDFRGANFTNTKFLAGYLNEINFSGTDLRTSTFHEDPNGVAYFSLSDFSNTKWSGLTLQPLSFGDVNLNNADFSGVTFLGNPWGNGPQTIFGNPGVTLVGTNFTNTRFVNTQFWTDLTQANLTGVVWESVRCPDGTNSDNNGNTCIGHLTYQP